MAFQSASVALIKKELLSNLRHARSFVCLVLFVGVGIIVTASAWPEQTSIVRAGQVSRELTIVVSGVMLGAAALFVPAFASSTIVIEKEQQTFDMLTLTLIRPFGMVMAKLLNTVGFFLLLVVAILPVLGVVFFLVGVDWLELGASFLLILMTTFSCAMVGILSSLLFRKAFVAILGGYAGMLFLMGGPLCFYLLAALVFGLRRLYVGSGLESFAEVTSPIGTLVVIFGGLTTGEVFLFILAMLYQLAFIRICYRLAMRVMKRPAEPARLQTAKPIDDPRILEARRKTFPYYLIDPLRRKKQIEDNMNPMFVKELRWGLMNRGTILIRVFYTTFIVYFIVGIGTVFIDPRNPQMLPWLMTQIVLTVVIAPALMANALTKEYELGNIDMLRMTLLKPRDIVLGKMWAGAASVAPALLAAVVSGIPAVFIGLRTQQWPVMFTGYVTLFVCTLVSLSLGLFSSLVTKRTTASLALSYILSLVVFLGLSMAAAYTSWYVFELAPTQPTMTAVLSFTSPIIAFIYNAEPRGYGQTHGSLLNSYWLGNVSAFTLFACGLIWTTIIGFEWYRMRDR